MAPFESSHGPKERRPCRILAPRLHRSSAARLDRAPVALQRHAPAKQAAACPVLRALAPSSKRTPNSAPLGAHGLTACLWAHPRQRTQHRTAALGPTATLCPQHPIPRRETSRAATPFRSAPIPLIIRDNFHHHSLRATLDSLSKPATCTPGHCGRFATRSNIVTL